MSETTMNDEEFKALQRKAFEEYCRVYASPNAESSIWYFLLWQAGADHMANICDGEIREQDFLRACQDSYIKYLEEILNEHKIKYNK